MKYAHIVEGKFISRPNRFIAHVDIAGKDTVVHVKNTGRCRELLVPGCRVYLEKSTNPERKTPYDLVTVEKVVEWTGGRKRKILVNMDSQAPNKVAGEWIRANRERFPNITFLKPEYTFGNSRFDFYIEYKTSGRKGASDQNRASGRGQKLHKMFLEVKGVTLENLAAATFPDAPTERGVKHLTELANILEEKICAEDGTPYECGILFLIQMKGCKTFGPAAEIHPDFAAALRRARDAGVNIFVVDCKVTRDELIADAPVPLIL